MGKRRAVVLSSLQNKTDNMDIVGLIQNNNNKSSIDNISCWAAAFQQIDNKQVVCEMMMLTEFTRVKKILFSSHLTRSRLTLTPSR